MLEWRDLLLTEGGTDRDREVESGIQHKAATFGARLQAAGPRGLQPMESAKPRFKVHGCDINSLTLRGTKTRSRHLPRTSSVAAIATHHCLTCHVAHDGP